MIRNVKAMAVALLVIAMSVGVVSAGGFGPATTGKLVEKDPISWLPVEGGAFGNLMYKGNMFVFTGHGLVPGMEYALINYDDPWGGMNPVLGIGTANEQGDLKISDKTSIFTTLTPSYGFTGLKVWLVPTSDIDEDGVFNTWQPANYLFEAELF